MKFRFGMIALAALAVCLSADPLMAQTQGPGGGGGGPSGPGGTVAPGTQMGRGNISQEDLNKLEDYANLSKRMTASDKDKGKTLKELLAEDKAAATKIAAQILPSCQVHEAILATEGKVTVDGKEVSTKTYEVSCSSGMGYFLVSQDPGKPYTISCFAADATRQADVEAGRKPGAVCQLPPNADVNAMATKLMSNAGKTCAVTNHRWVGQNAASRVEFEEVACSNKTGYMLTVSLGGHSTPLHVSTCHASAMRGLPCKMSDNGEIVTVDTFKNALEKHGVACDANDKDVRVIGQEKVQKRYVVEFKCSQRPKGLVAYIPLEDATAPFEAVDCAVAAKRGAQCKLTPGY